MARLGGALNLRGVAFANLAVEQIQRHSALFTAVETKTGLSLRSADLFVLHFPEGSDANTMNQADGSILFVSTGHGGQTNALISIASELSRRGVANLWFASTDNHRINIEGAASGSPIYFASCGITDRIKELVEDPAIYATFANQGPLTSNSFVVAMRWMLDEERLTVEYRRILAYIDQVQPRLMVIDISTISGIDAAVTRRIPFILSVPCTPSALFIEQLPWDYPAPGSGLPRQMTAAQKLANLWYRLRIQIVLATRFSFFSFAARRKVVGIRNPLASFAEYCDAAKAIFCYSVFGLEYPFPVPRHLHLLGAMVPSPPPVPKDSKDELLRWLDSHSSVIYVGLGTLVQLSQSQIITLLTAFKLLGPNQSVLWKLPQSQQALLPSEEFLPNNIRVECWIPSQVGVLAHSNVRVFLTHGGGNGFHEGIYFGKPLLVMPFWLDCFDFAIRAVESGVGLALERPPAFTAGEVAAKLDRLLTNTHFHERAQYWGEQLRKAGGVRRAADLILTMLDA